MKFTEKQPTEKTAVEPEAGWEEFRRYPRRGLDVRIKIAINNNGVQTYVYGRGNDIAEGGMAAYVSMEMGVGSQAAPAGATPCRKMSTIRSRIRG